MDVNRSLGRTGGEWGGAAPHEPLDRHSRPVMPGDDPFYVPPAGFEQAAPGAVLRSRDVQLAFLGLIPQRFTATQLLYRSTDMNDEPTAIVTTVLAPAERTPRSPSPIVSYHCAIA